MKPSLSIKNLLLPAEPFNLTIPYSDRQRIVVVTDEEADAERKSRAGQANREDYGFFSIADSGTVTGGSPDDPAATGAAALIARQLRRNLQDARNAGANVKRALDDRAVRGRARQQLGALMVGRGEAGAVHFDQGHPLKNYLYVGHPAKRDLYYPAAEFHRRVFDHKFVEAVRLLTALGACRIAVHTETNRTEKREWVNLAVRQGFSRTRNEMGRQAATFEAEYPGNGRPVIPSDLCWYPDEPAWQMIASARAESGARKTSLALTYTTDYGIDIHVMKAAGACGVNIGGRFEKQQDIVWRLEAEFPALSRLT